MGMNTSSDEDDGDCPLLDELKPTIIIKKPSRSIVVEPLVFLYFYCQWGMTPLMSQYVFTKIGKTYNYTQPGIGNNNTSRCYLNTSDPMYILQQEIEGETSIFNLLLSTSTTVPALFLTLYMGGYTDRRGRRLGVVLPVIGVCLQSLVYVAVIYFNANICFMFIGALLFGFSGSNAVFLMAIFSYIADCTNVSNRSRRITAIEILWAGGSCISSFSLGFWISASGFLWPMVCLSSLLVLSTFYSIFFVPETVVSSQNTSISVFEILKEGLDVFRKESVSSRPLKLFLLLCAFVLTDAVETTYSGTQTLYLMDSPLCFTSAEIGITNGVITSSLGVGAALGIFLLLKVFKLSDSLATIIGCLSAAARFTFLGMANTRLLVFLSAMFAVVAFLEGIIGLVGSTSWSMVYANTLLYYPGFVFFIMALVNVFGAIFVGVYQGIVRGEKCRTRLAQMRPIDGCKFTDSSD